MRALVVIDVQVDFCPGGRLAVPDGDAVVPICNRLMAVHDHVVLTVDWHPPDHQSFASVQGGEPYDVVQMPYGDQVLWPDHCVQGSPGAELHPDLDTSRARIIIRKGMNPAVDSYSAFFENDHTTPTGLHGALQELGVTALTMVGLATDFCVKYSALDARRLGYDVTIVQEGVRGIDIDGSVAATLSQLTAAGVQLA